MKIHVLTAAVAAAFALQSASAANENCETGWAFRSAPVIEVTAPASDEALAAEVQQKIHDRSSLRFFRMSVWSVDRAVYLDGQVDTLLDSSEAEDVARSVAGVQAVYNHLSLSNG